MPIQYKIDVINALRERGYTTYKLRQEKLLSEGALQNIRDHAPISWANIDRLCELLNCQPGDIMEYVPDK